MTSFLEYRTMTLFSLNYKYGLNTWCTSLQALTKGGQVLQDFLKAHPDMRATIPVLLASLRKMQ